MNLATLCRPKAVVLLICLACGYSISSPAQAAADPMSARLDNMQRLLNESSGARQVIDSGNAEAADKREQALELYRKAREKFSAGARDEASAMLDASARMMFDAIKTATPASMLEDKKKVDYGNRKQSVAALREAFERISDETGDSETRRQVEEQLTKLVDRADVLIAQGDSSAAQVELDKAYHLLKVSIENKRAGQTLVRSLHFETREEEYLYEIDRNETHAMLIELLVNEKGQSQYVRGQIDKFVEQAQQLRGQAENYADAGEYNAAIDLLEQSTRQLVRAIRSAGIYIPG